MLKYVIPAVFLIAILALLLNAPKQILENILRRHPRALLLLPVLMCGAFAAVLFMVDALSWQLMAAMIGYTLVPVLVAIRCGTSPPSWADAALVLFLWLPLEFAGAAAHLIPRPAQGTVHTVAYGIAILTALIVFLIYRQIPGMKYGLFESPRDVTNPLIAWVVVAPILIPLGIAIHFMDAYHSPRMSLPTIVIRFLLILAATAIPEEILFRGLIQNWLTLRFGQGNAVVLLASIIFGIAHFNNAPGPPPNWRYIIMATLAGFAYGKVFQKSSTVLSSATLHALVNTTKHIFF